VLINLKVKESSEQCQNQQKGKNAADNEPGQHNLPF